jgi:Cu(I)/Ag(I) efflux system membrane fusion protein
MRRPLLLGEIASAAVLVVAAVLAARLWWAPVGQADADQAHAADHVHQPGTASSPSPAPSRADVTIDPVQQQLLGVRTVEVVRGPIERSLQTVGVVQYDQARLTDVNAKFDGWIRELYVASAGQSIGRGQPLLSLYSPDLLRMQTDYLLALRTYDQVRESAPDALDRAEELLGAARRELEWRDVSQADVAALHDARDQLGDVTFLSPEAGTMTLRSPASGVVIDEHVVNGQHVSPGDSLYRIADLSVVWVEADVQEVDAAAVPVGTRASVTIDAYPGESLSGRVVFVSPLVNERTRTCTVRLEFPNPGRRLKPGMYANVELALESDMGLTVPVDAVLDTGVEQIVFVARAGDRFHPQHVTAGRRLGDAVEIVAGLAEGDRVATGATFFLESESQLRGLASSASLPAAAHGPKAPRPVEIAFRTDPDPPAAADSRFEVTARDADGKAIDDAEVAMELFMPAMPSMNMPAMRSSVALAPSGEGLYHGRGSVAMAGRWDATVIVKRGGLELGREQFSLLVR